MKRCQFILIWLVVVVFFGLSFSGCKRVLWSTIRPILRIDRGPYVPFTSLDFDFPGIEHPVQSWTYHWPENYESILEAACSPVVDEEGNIYFIGSNGYLYSLDPAGEVRWKKKGFDNSMVLTQEGLVAHTRMNSLIHFDFDGNIKWEVQGCWGSMFDPLHLAPNGYVLFSDDDFIVTIDAQGKTMWVLPLEDSFFKNCFFDENSNAYLTYFDSYDEDDPRTKEGQESIEYYMISVSPEGRMRWRKTICHEWNFNDDFSPKDGRIQDTFLLALSTSPLQKGQDDLHEDRRRRPKVITAYNTDGEELWNMVEERYGLFENEYAVGPNGNLYTYFNAEYEEYDGKNPSSRYAGSTLQCISPQGDTIWAIPFEDQIGTAPSFDSERNLYIGTRSKNYNDNLYSFTSDGIERWSLRDIEVACGFNFQLVLSPKQKIHFTTGGQSLLFCIEEKKE
jgi:outer membrane protein assembly factor BamB